MPASHSLALHMLGNAVPPPVMTPEQAAAVLVRVHVYFERRAFLID